VTSSLNPGPARAGISPERPPRVSLPAATISHHRQVTSLSDHRFSFAARPRIFSTDQQARSTTAATPSPNSVRAPPPELAAGPLRRAIRPLQALGEPHPGPPLLYALVLVAVAPGAIEPPTPASSRRPEPPRRRGPCPQPCSASLGTLVHYPCRSGAPRPNHGRSRALERRLGFLRSRAAAEQRHSGDPAPPPEPPIA